MDGPNFNEDYLRRLIDQDDGTERHFIAYFGDLLRIKLRSRLRSTQLIEDVKQETFLRFFKGLREGKEIHQPERLPAYVNKVCGNILMERYRDLHKYQGTGFEMPEQADESWNPDEALVNRERKQVIREMLDEMPEKERRLLEALFLEERDKDEICREFRVDREYLRVRIHRSKNRARAIFVRKQGAAN